MSIGEVWSVPQKARFALERHQPDLNSAVGLAVGEGGFSRASVAVLVDQGTAQALWTPVPRVARIQISPNTRHAMPFLPPPPPPPRLLALIPEVLFFTLFEREGPPSMGRQRPVS